MEFLRDIIKIFSFFDICYLIITILSVIKCFRKGFVLSILSASKWLLAYIITLIIFPRIKPYVDGVIENEYILDIMLGVGIFIIVIFVILIINKGLSRAVKFSGLGKLDTIFGFFFGFFRGYIISVCIFSTISIFYNYNKWPINIKSSWSFSYVEKGSNYLLREFPDEKKYKETKEKIKDI